MAVGPAKHRHHYTPVHYLRNFADSNGLLHVVSVINGNRRVAKPEAEGFERDLYWLDSTTGARGDGIEEAFSQFESEATPIVNRVIADRVLPTNDDDLSMLYNFIAFSNVRLPSSRSTIANPIRQSRRIIGSMLLSNWETFQHHATKAGLAPTKEMFEKLKAEERAGRAEPPDITTEEFLHYAMVKMDAMLEWIPRRTWSVVYSDEPGEHFVTSDHPVSLSWSDGHFHPMYPPGHAHERTDLVMPLGSTVALVGRYVDVLSGTHKATLEAVAAINLKTIFWSGRFIAGCQEDFVVGGNKGEALRTSAEVVADIKMRPPRRDRP